MNAAALLIGAIASLVSAVGGLTLGLAAMRRASPREREGAAENAAERLLATAHRLELEELIQHLSQEQSQHDRPEPPGIPQPPPGHGDPTSGGPGT